MDRNTKDKKKVEYEDIFENGDKAKDTENAENDTEMNTTDRNTKDKKKGEHEDIFENGDEAKDTENAEYETKMKMAIQQPR